MWTAATLTVVLVLVIVTLYFFWVRKPSKE